MTVQIKRAELWGEVEMLAQQWQESLRLDYPLIPLLPLWNSAAGAGVSSLERLLMESHGTENLLLKAEVQRLRRQLERVTGDVSFATNNARNVN